MKMISVIIPTYKPDYYIWECLDSIKDQSLDKFFFEVLIILNGDKEPYFVEIKNYIKRNKLFNFKLIYTEEKGVSNARNIGIEISQGDYIAFIDDDDYISENYLLNFEKIKSEDSLCIASFTNFKKKYVILKEIKYKINDSTSSLNKYRKIFSYIGGKIISKKIIGNIKFDIRLKNGEDSLFMAAISKNIKYIKTSDQDTIYYRRIRENSASFKKKEKKYILKNGYEQIKEYISFYHNNQYDKIFVLIRIMAVIKGMFVNIFRRKI
ncbi:glycosyltransferase family 2 protein [Fusobacterium varium]|nr:glycosyltransferase family 2 protein [Fusobacterium varium]